MTDPIAAQNLFDALKSFANSGSTTRTWYEVAKDFQTTIAAVIALTTAAGAALVAFRGAKLSYKGALAKVEFDREVHERQLNHARLGLYLRLASQLRRIVRDFDLKAIHFEKSARRLDARAKAKADAWRASHANEPRRFFEVRDIVWETKAFPSFNEEFDEIEQAWRQIHLLPPDAFDHLDVLRTTLPKLKNDSEPFIGKPIPVTFGSKYVASQFRLAIDESKSLLAILDDSIVHLRRFN